MYTILLNKYSITIPTVQIYPEENHSNLLNNDVQKPQIMLLYYYILYVKSFSSPIILSNYYV